MDLRFLRLRRWLLKQQPNKTVFNRFIKNEYQIRQRFAPEGKMIKLLSDIGRFIHKIMIFYSQ